MKHLLPWTFAGSFSKYNQEDTHPNKTVMISIFALQTVDVVAKHRVDLLTASFSCQRAGAFPGLNYADRRQTQSLTPIIALALAPKHRLFTARCTSA